MNQVNTAAHPWTLLKHVLTHWLTQKEIALDQRAEYQNKADIFLNDHPHGAFSFEELCVAIDLPDNLRPKVAFPPKSVTPSIIAEYREHIQNYFNAFPTHAFDQLQIEHDLGCWRYTANGTDGASFVERRIVTTALDHLVQEQILDYREHSAFESKRMHHRIYFLRTAESTASPSEAASRNEKTSKESDTENK